MTETEDLRAATREAHEAMKDMKILMRDARCLIADIEQAAHREVGEQISMAVRAGMAGHRQAIEDAIEDATALVYQRFAEIGDILMGEDRNAKRAGSAIQRLAEEWVSKGT